MENPVLDEDTVDDLLYFARTAETSELNGTLEQAARTSGWTARDVLIAAKDIESGNTALHMAAANGHSEIITHLLSFWQTGESVPVPSSFLNARNKNGNTPLHWAALNGHLQSVQILAEAGADVLLKNDAGRDAIFEAELANKEEVVTWLLRAQIDDGIPDAEQETDAGEVMENGVMEEETDTGKIVENGVMGEDTRTAE